MQVGPTPTMPTVSDLPPEIQDWRDMERAKAGEGEIARLPGRLESCLHKARSDPDTARKVARDWREIADAEEAPQAGHCLGFAESRLGDFAAAQAAFTGARLAVPVDDRRYRTRLGLLAGNAALAAGEPEQALALLRDAEADAQASGDAPLIGEVALDHARALVSAGREGEAELALATARSNLPEAPLAWLLSATLSRRLGKLAEAQAQISEAARLDPFNPEIGMEAGVIAILDGREDAARKSWKSVLETAPDSASATQAQAYLAQLDAP